MKNIIIRFWAAATVLALPTITAAMGAEQNIQSDLEKVKVTLTKRYPSTRFQSVKASPITGLYEVIMGKNIAYTVADGRYFLFGHLFDMQAREDLTASAMKKNTMIDWSQLPLADAIAFGDSHATKKIAVFSDPECPFCKKLEAQLLGLKDVRIYVFPYPIAQLHPGALGLAQAIWCSKDRSLAWRQYLLQGVKPGPATPADCANPIQKNIHLAQSLGVDGTPMIYATDGRSLSGYVSAEEIEHWLAQTDDDHPPRSPNPPSPEQTRQTTPIHSPSQPASLSVEPHP